MLNPMSVVLAVLLHRLGIALESGEITAAEFADYLGGIYEVLDE